MSDEPLRCPGYECGPGRTWIEAHKDEPAGRELVLPPGHFWYDQGGYIAHEPQRIVHYHWPPQCGLPSPPARDTWSGNLDLVTCAHCREETITATGIVDEAEEFGFGRNAAPPWATASYLDEVRLRSRTVGANGGPGPGRADRRHRANEQSARDVPRLVAAIDAALRLAAELDAEDVFNPAWPVSRGDRIRDAITTALLETRMIV